MPTNRELNERFDRLYPQVADMVTNFSRGFARSTNRLLHRVHDAYPDVDDFRQEAAIKLLHTLESSWEKSDEEILKVFPTVILNKFRDMYRNTRVYTSLIEYGPVLDEIEAPIEDSYADLLLNDHFNTLLGLQDRKFDRTVLKLMMYPDEELVKIIMEDDTTTQMFTHNEIYIKHEHLARRLQVSRPTISRSLDRIRETLKSLLGTLSKPR